ncbi:DNA polymerase III subunit epsilon [Rhodophyticola sp. CCM32]|uniref:3'-5' exonuclease n=1 Tax=Rhodophyticola sp. CCM32 TaxID=2916397 RepID=UPI00107F2BFA|nr:exonuclease domain-containing protein [Rhodophyticola sp. CCM32]QBX99418.1 DNA polymerase III subunit epsilon [Rhodophyticola sp. CCM32]
MFTHLSLRLRIFIFFAALACGAALLVLGGLTLGYTRLGEDHALSSFVIAGVVAVFAVVALITWVWVLFDEYIARPVERLAADMRARAHAGVGHDIDHAPARYLGDLAPAAAAVAANLTEARNAMALSIGRETARLGLEKTRLETLLAEVPDGVLFCTPDHVVVLYNGQAREILEDHPALGLNRPLSGVLLPGPIRQAYDRLLAAEAREGADILCATRAGAKLLAARIRLMWLEGQETKRPGYILSLQDVTGDLQVQAERAHLLNDLLDEVDRALPDLPADIPAVQALAARAAETARRKALTDTEWWPKEALPASDLGIALTARLARKGITLTTDLPATTLRCDGFAITRLLERLALEWSVKDATDLQLRLVEIAPASATLALSASGALPDADVLARALDIPLSPGLAQFTGRDVLVTHATQLVTAASGMLHLTLSRADPDPAMSARAVLYDFELLHAEVPRAMSEAMLKQLSYVVFDTETTGLNPQVDEICQIAAVRIVNGKVIDGERFDMLVNPGRRIPQGSIDVHGVTNEMVADAAPVGEALKRFHAYANGAVLVAHNAPFDMSFLQRRETEIGTRFDQPILDTVLCSAILYGQSADHTLDALCERLGILIAEADRHTAIGDAIGTAEAFRKMIPMLDAADLPTLGATIKAFDKHSRLIAHLN